MSNSLIAVSEPFFPEFRVDGIVLLAEVYRVLSAGICLPRAFDTTPSFPSLGLERSAQGEYDVASGPVNHMIYPEEEALAHSQIEATLEVPTSYETFPLT